MRTTIHYDGKEYVVARAATALQEEIAAILETGAPGWLHVNHGRGQLQRADILVDRGVPIGLVDSSDPE